MIIIIVCKVWQTCPLDVHSLKSPGILLKGLLLKVAILAKKKTEKLSKKSKKYRKTTEKIHAFQNEFQNQKKNAKQKTKNGTNLKKKH